MLLQRHSWSCSASFLFGSRLSNKLWTPAAFLIILGNFRHWTYGKVFMKKAVQLINFRFKKRKSFIVVQILPKILLEFNNFVIEVFFQLQTRIPTQSRGWFRWSQLPCISILFQVFLQSKAHFRDKFDYKLCLFSKKLLHLYFSLPNTVSIPSTTLYHKVQFFPLIWGILQKFRSFQWKNIKT